MDSRPAGLPVLPLYCGPHVKRTLSLASFPGLPRFSFSVCIQHKTRKLPCLILNANRRTKTGEAWERGYIESKKHSSPTCDESRYVDFSFPAVVKCTKVIPVSQSNLESTGTAKMGILTFHSHRITLNLV